MRTVVFMQEVKGRPDTQYGWYGVSNSWRYMQLRQSGWQPVTGDHAREIYGDAYDSVKDENGYVRYKGLVLHSRPLQRKLEEEAEGAIRRAQRRQIPQDKFLEEIDRIPNLKPFVMKSLEEYRDRKAHDLGMTAPRVVVPGAPDVAAAAAKEVKHSAPPPPPKVEPKPTPGPVTESAKTRKNTSTDKE